MFRYMQTIQMDTAMEEYTQKQEDHIGAYRRTMCAHAHTGINSHTSGRCITGKQHCMNTQVLVHRNLLLGYIK